LRKEIGELDKATEIIREVYSAANKPGQNETLILYITHILPINLNLQGNYEEAFEVASHVFNRRKELLGSDHTET